MSREPESSGWHHTYGPPSGRDHDRHIQSIIDHASSLFPEAQDQLPQIFAPLTDDWATDVNSRRKAQNPQEEDGYVGLDDFGKPQ
jgi:hypothetical protein